MHSLPNGFPVLIPCQPFVRRQGRTCRKLHKPLEWTQGSAGSFSRLPLDLVEVAFRRIYSTSFIWASAWNFRKWLPIGNRSVFLVILVGILTKYSSHCILSAGYWHEWIPKVPLFCTRRGATLQYHYGQAHCYFWIFIQEEYWGYQGVTRHLRLQVFAWGRGSSSYLWPKGETNYLQEINIQYSSMFSQFFHLSLRWKRSR